jgi:hypothetical protein
VRRRFFLVGLMVCLFGAMTVTQCGYAIGSTTTTAAAPPCYKAFWPGQEVRFKLVVPAEYFFGCPECETPLITGWRVESSDGMLIYDTSFVDVPKGHWYVVSWDQRDHWGNAVLPGYYKLVIQTTAGEFLDFVYITPCNLCPCCCCSQGLYDSPCPIACEWPYIDFLPTEGSWCPFCSPLRISLFFGTESTP